MSDVYKRQVPALVIGIGLALILFATGGTDNPLNYVVLVVSILCMSCLLYTSRCHSA